jgi:putative transposon-encoded protein
MKIKNIQPTNELAIKNIEGFIKSKVTWYGTGAKVDCPKRYLGHEVYLVILENGTKKESKGSGRKFRKSPSKNRRAEREDIRPRENNRRA